MPRKKTSKAVKKRVKKDDTPVQCTSCGKFKPKSDFYISYNEMHALTGVLPYCKSCIKKMCNDKFNQINKEKTLKMLRTIDRPFINSVWEKTLEKGGVNAIGTYLKSINLLQKKEPLCKALF